MPLMPFLVAIASIVAVALIFTIIVGFNPGEKKSRTFMQRSRNLLVIYSMITLLLLLSFFAYLQFG